MADFIRFTKLPIDINGTEIFATSANMAESLPLQRINSLGYNGAIAVAASGPVEGTWSVDFTYTNGMVSLLDDAFRKNWDNKISITFGGNTYNKAVMTSLRFSAEANSVVTCSAGGNFYTCLGQNDGIAAGIEKGPLEPANYEAVGHGSKTAVAGLSSEYFNFNWEASRTLTSIYKLNDANPIHLDFSDETIVASAQGNNLQSCITSACDAVDADFSNVCPKQAEMTFTIGDLCGDGAWTADQKLTADGFVQDRNVEVTEGDVLRGNITVVDWYGARTEDGSLTPP
jgi:hypothetical protein